MTTTKLLLDYITIVATAFLTICYLPQIAKTFRTKDVSGISLPFWIFLNLALSLMLINSIVIYIEFGTWGYMVTEIINESLAFIMLVMVLRYRKIINNEKEVTEF